MAAGFRYPYDVQSALEPWRDELGQDFDQVVARLADRDRALEDYLGGWQAYTPSNTAVTLGNGTLTGRYTRVGRTITATVKLTFGSTTAFTGDVFIGVPFAAANLTADYTGTLHMIDAGVRRWTGVWLLAASATSGILAHTESTNNGVVNATAPFAWGTSDELQCTITYEAAL